MTKNSNFKKVKTVKEGYIVDGAFIPKDESNRHYQELKNWIDNGGKVESEFDLEEIKNQKIQEAENFRKNLQFKPIIYRSSEFSASATARQNIFGSIVTLSNSAKKYWRDNNNNSHNFSSKNFKELGELISQRDTKLYLVEAELKTKINKSRSVKTLTALKIDELWKSKEEKI